MVDKSEVNYRRATDPSKRCGVCVMFRDPHDCTLVRGYIERHMVCERFAAKHGPVTRRMAQE